MKGLNKLMGFFLKICVLFIMRCGEKRGRNGDEKRFVRQSLLSSHQSVFSGRRMGEGKWWREWWRPKIIKWKLRVNDAVGLVGDPSVRVLRH